MNKKKNLKSKRIKAIKIFSFIIIGVGILFILYPLYTNFVTARKETAILSAWDDQKEVFFKEKETDEVIENSNTVSTDIIETEENKIGNDETFEATDDPRMEVDSIDGGTAKYENLTAEDFFPLKISIPKIELEWIAYEGTERETLKNGPGHETLTPLPGDIGRCTISGHRTTYGAPFNRVDELEEGDLIYLETIKGELFTYMVTGLEIVKPTDVYILEGSDKKELLLTACHPKFSAVNRLVIIAELINIYPLGMES